MSYQSSYSLTLERKIGEVFEHLEVDAKKALRVIQKEIDTRGKKIMASELMQLRIVRGLVLEMTGKLDEARAEVLGVLKEVKETALADHYVLDTFLKTTQRMTAREEYMAEYLKVIEILHAKHPKDKELVFTLFNGALSNN